MPSEAKHLTSVRHAPAALGRLLAVMLLAASASGAEPWVDLRIAGPFVCRADFPLSDMEGFFGELAQLQDDLTRHLGIRPPPERIELFLFRDEASYRRYLRAHLPNMPYRRALYIKDGGPGRVLAHRGREFHVDIRHECTHALLHATLPMVPLWLDEGVAEYFELPRSQRAYDNPYLDGVVWAARFGIVPRLENLEKKADFAGMGRNDYRDSWAWVHFMLHGSAAARDELVRFLASIQANAPPGALSQRLARRLPDARREFASHFKRWKRPAHQPLLDQARGGW
ncbi:MAG: hypothetical protein JW809_06365 [Pirellulales bacterium]|nr:hypothetical protein [Pirellulales bacterium]